MKYTYETYLTVEKQHLIQQYQEVFNQWSASQKFDHELTFESAIEDLIHNVGLSNDNIKAEISKLLSMTKGA